jgi:MoaA/NifB/PqqE/SkfB family radical SAM enzyme
MMDKLNTKKGKFCDPKLTCDGNKRAHVKLQSLDTLWFNTGTLCNIECANCYINSSPKNDALVYISHDEVLRYFDEIKDHEIAVQEIGLTGGEPFMNPDILKIMRSILSRGFKLLILTNAMRPMMRHKEALLAIKNEFSSQLSLRISVDHYSEEVHQCERGHKSWQPMVLGLKWLSDNGFDIHVAGRTFNNEGESELRQGYTQLFKELDVNINAKDTISLILFPEMDQDDDVVEITNECWQILKVNPNDMMCATSRMIVKHKGTSEPSIMSCTLLPYDQQFNMGHNLITAKDNVSLNHPFCSTFCVLGGASCSN